jgi:hypothetical protein
MLPVVECQEVFSKLLPFTENEKSFFDRLLDEGEIEPSLITVKLTVFTVSKAMIIFAKHSTLAPFQDR